MVDLGICTVSPHDIHNSVSMTLDEQVIRAWLIVTTLLYLVNTFLCYKTLISS